MEGKNNRILDAFSKHYIKANTLRLFLKNENPRFHEILDKKEDSDYSHFLDTTLISVLPGAKLFPKTLDFMHLSTIDEILVRVFIKLKKRKTDFNIIISRLHSSEEAYLTLRSLKTFCERNDFSYFFQDHWNTLLEHVGDVVLEYLLEYCSIFLLLSNSCYIQISGIPLQDIVTKNKYLINSDHICKLKENKFTRIKKKETLCVDKAVELCVEREVVASDNFNDVVFHLPEADSSTLSEKTSKPIQFLNTEKSDPIKVKRKRKRKRNGEFVKDYKAFDENITIDKNSLLYSKEPQNKSVSKFVLNFAPNGSANLTPTVIKSVLLKVQLFKNAALKNCNLDLADKSFEKLHSLFSTLLKHHKRGKHKYYFNHCIRYKDLQKDISNLRQQDGATVLRSLLQYHTPQWKVYLFIKLCITNVVPFDLFGDPSNKIIFCRNVKRIIFGGRFETISLNQLMNGIKSTCNWLKHVGSNSDRLQILARIHVFLMENYVISLIKSYFYVTDCTIYKNRLFYFPKSVWKLVCQIGFENLMDNGMLELIPDQKAKDLITEGKSLGIGYLRFMPKANSVRLIANMKKKQKQYVADFREKTINWQLQDLLRVFNFVKSKKPYRLGSSLFSVSDIHKKWKNYRTINTNYNGPHYFVKVDIKSCYDSMSQKKMYCFAKEFLKPPTTYCILRYSSITLGSHKPIVNYVREAMESSAYHGNFFQYISNVVQTAGFTNKIFVHTDNPWHVETSELLTKLKAHLLGNILKYGKNFYLQTKGISQGSVISTMLCNIYYGHMESKCLKLAKDELLMRQVDDFLLVTKNLKRAKSFLNTMLNGIPEYNFTANTDKTLVNFDYLLSSGSPCPKSGNFFPFCGFLFNTETLEVCPNFSKYAGLSMKDTISTGYTSHPGLALESKLIFSLKFHCNVIFFDPSLNSLQTIANNAYKIFFLTAFKFVHCVKSLPLPDSVNKNPKYFIKVLNSLSICLHKKCLQKANLKCDSGILSKWLCYKAFETRLSQHIAQFHSILKLIKHWLNSVHSLELLKDLNLDLYPQEFQLIYF